ncbi:cytochrome c biogenesis protein CcsA [Massilia sp. W12]|uniref:cytochrome C assembly family protein n=1 Tax=Massilia sp. W12 TaxID=3126507 RepID=UPI0030CF0C8C
MLIFCSTIAALLYLLCAFAPQRPDLRNGGVLLAWLLQAGFLWQQSFVPGGLRLGFAVVLSLTMWVSVAAWLLENRNLALDGLRVLMLPVAAVSCLLPLAFPGALQLLEHKSPLFGWHILIAILAYASLTIAVFHAVLMALQESRLHARQGQESWFGAILDRLPALLTMERLLFRLIAIGFTLLSLTVLSGIVFSEQLFGRPLRFDHKTVFTLLSWFLFGILLAGRSFRGWRGKTALGFTLSGFGALLLAYVGSRFVLEVILHRGSV